MRKLRKSRERKGFTLIELAVAILIMSILAGIVYLGLKSGSAGAIKATMLNDIRTDFAAETQYYELTDSFKSVNVSGGNTGKRIIIDENYPSIKAVASPGNNVQITASDTNGDGLNDKVVIQVTNTKLPNVVCKYDNTDDDHPRPYCTTTSSNGG